jgi:hypothetical protein
MMDRIRKQTPAVHGIRELRIPVDYNVTKHAGRRSTELRKGFHQIEGGGL